MTSDDEQCEAEALDGQGRCQAIGEHEFHFCVSEEGELCWTDRGLYASRAAMEYFINKAKEKSMTDVDIALPQYQCHKRVWALRIQRVETDADGGTITPEEKGYAPFRVSFEYVQKHDPQVGGYWVQYEDGYQSFSPAAAFEGGYTRVG